METKPVWEDRGNDGFDASKANPILVFWNNRLVPHEKLKDLWFLQPKSQSIAVQEFRHRCCGILFFPRQMKISRNKMNLLTDKPSLYDALLDTGSSGNCVWNRNTSTSLSWLKVLIRPACRVRLRTARIDTRNLVGVHRKCTTRMIKKSSLQGRSLFQTICTVPKTLRSNA